MSARDAEMIFLFHAVKNLYREPQIPPPPLEEVSIPKLLKVSMRNNIAYYVSKILLYGYGDQLSPSAFALLRDFVRVGENRIIHLKRVTITLKSCLDQYVIQKTYRAYPRIPNDIDVLVWDLREALKKLRSAGMRIRRFDDHEVMLVANGQVQMHLHDKISWAHSTFLDGELVHERPRTVTLWDVEARIPNVDADFLIHIAHIIFEPLHFTISDFLYVCKIAPAVNWSIVINQAKKYHWIRAFSLVLSLLDGFHHTLYAGACPFGKLGFGHVAEKRASMAFPRSLPRGLVVSAFIEKRLFRYLTGKLLKASYVFFTGDTYRAFYLPPEQALSYGTEGL